MIFLILSEYGFNEILANAEKQTDKLWLNKTLLSDESIAVEKANGWDIQIFSETINVKSEQSLVKAIKYIEKKWPNETIEVEYL